MIRVRGKGRKERISPLGSFAARALHRYMSNRDRDPADPKLRWWRRS
ncbi:MAG: hypothetical protein R3C05_21100 [Pirellulaceae bacterium]